MIRGIIQIWSSLAGKIARFTASGRPGETLYDREAMQHYGFSSSPKPGAEGTIMYYGNSFIMIAEDDRRYRIALENGEVALYTDEGDKIHLKRGRKIEVTAGAAAAAGEITIQANGAGSVKVSADAVTLGKSATLNIASGVVTQLCSCSITGAPHPVGSQTVKATL
jgi:phage gp45-like